LPAKQEDKKEDSYLNDLFTIFCVNIGYYIHICRAKQEKIKRRWTGDLYLYAIFTQKIGIVLIELHKKLRLSGSGELLRGHARRRRPAAAGGALVWLASTTLSRAESPRGIETCYFGHLEESKPAISGL
jgi:hypothetical protein